MSGDEDEIAKGEASPGWRRNAERRAERAQSDRLPKRQQRALQERAGFSGEGGAKAKR
jgi:hypothetical protein